MTDFDITCRCCRSVDNGNLVSLFEIHPSMHIPLSSTLVHISGIQIIINDGLPSNICGKCARMLENAEKLKAIAIQSDAVFRMQVKIKTDSEQNVGVGSIFPLREMKLEDTALLFDDNIDNDEQYANQVDNNNTTSSIEQEEELLLEQVEEEKPKKLKVEHKAKKTKTKRLRAPVETDSTPYRLPTREDFACCMCVNYFDSKSQLLEHLRTHSIPPNTDTSPEYTVECSMCFKRFKDNKNLRLHQVRKYRPKSTQIHQCKHCGKIFNQHGSMKYCEMKHEGKLEKFECAICKATFNIRSNLRTHMHNVHSDLRKYSCDLCGDAFKQQAVLQRHLLTHTQEKNFSCELCGKRFSTSSSLVVHKRVHTGERPYSCTFSGCNKTFIHASDRYRHTMSHTGERPHACTAPDCTKKFRTRTLLKMHFRMHIGVKEFKCKLCPVEYFQPRSLKRHMAEKHSALGDLT